MPHLSIYWFGVWREGADGQSSCCCGPLPLNTHVMGSTSGARKKARVVKHWHRLPGEVADAPSLGTFKVSLDGALSNVIKLKMSLLIAR